PPLDGSKILAGLLPSRYLPVILNLERYGFAILMLLSLTGILSLFLGPAISFVSLVITTLLGVETLQLFF
ncbi:MAG TPA: hypothetical protein VNT57_07665, partial [Desulfobacteria bacterium]|nr:hypothetical protein [Desulfobacteria bacterium]